MSEELLPASKTAKSAYEPSEVEARWTKHWFDNDCFRLAIDPRKPNYSIVLPPPNITGNLHMGHAFNGTLQDMLIRHKRMTGHNVLFQPGTDHAGISTQMVVERKLKAQGKNRHDMGREAFQAEIWDWRNQYGATIMSQYRRLGVSFAWDRPVFTMDEAYAGAVRRAFVELYREGHIYRGKRITSWCPHCMTSLSDLEVKPEPTQGHLYLIDYRLADESGEKLTIATTRPESMFGDAAICVHPDDERYARFVGKNVRLPLTGRQIPIIADRLVEREFGTAVLRITPAHNAADWEVGRRHNLPAHTVWTAEAKVAACDLVPPAFHGMNRPTARQAIVEALKEAKHLQDIQDHVSSIGHCERCQTPIEPSLSDQWYLKMSELAKPAIEAVESGQVRFIPDRFASTYLEWMRNIRDWNISRQLWWGHRIPIWTCDNGHTDAFEEAPTKCAHCDSATLTQDPDVLDTWFSSALWPFATLGWPEETPLLEKFYPTATLSTAREIINLWVSRMIFMGLRFTGKVPFSDVLIHPVIQTPDGKRMTKSKNNAIDPLDTIAKYGTDANRYYFASIGIKGDQDVRFREDRLGDYKRFVNKLFNVGRFVVSQLGDYTPTPVNDANLTLPDRWILHRYNTMLAKVDAAYAAFDFHEVARELHEFTWDCFCDWYVEMAKIQITGGAEGQTRNVLYTVYEGLLRALHPIMPFITEELWSHLPKVEAASSLPSIMFADYPAAETRWLDEQSEKDMDLLIACIHAIRDLRSNSNIGAAKETELMFVTSDPMHLRLLEAGSPYLRRMARASSIAVLNSGQPEVHAASAIVASVQIFIPLTQVVDAEKVKAKLLKQKESLEREIARTVAITEKPDFKAKAPKETLDKMAAKLSALRSQLSDIEAKL